MRNRSAWTAGIAPETIVGASLLGLLLCGYCLILIGESKKHIIRNWDRAECCKNQINNLDDILDYVSPEKETKKGPMAYVWNQVLCVVGVFAILFVATLVWVLEGQSL